MAVTHASQKRYPPELKERAVRMARDAIAEQGGQRLRGGPPDRQAARCRRRVAAELAQAGRDRRGQPAGDLQRGQRSDRRAAQGGPRSPAGERHLEGGLGFLRDRARRSPEEVVRFIDAHRDCETGGRRWGVEPICEVLEVAPSTYYAAKSRPPSARAVRDAEVSPGT